jgi:class 3 adenylate cyclase/tetratricopeptide (TPR) repeat protein
MERASAGGVVTVLITDVVGSTALRTRVGDEGAQGRLGAIEQAISEEIARHNGRVVKFLGDGILASFHSPRNAVACATAIQDSTESLNRTYVEDPLLVRVGLNTGEVVLEGDDLHGETVNGASRISALAEGGQILVSSVVKELVGTIPDTDFVDRGLHQLKGFPHEWRLYEVVRDKPGVVLLDRTPFVAREEELTELRARIERAQRGQGFTVMIAGEAGVGKTRLATEAAQEARRRGFLTFFGHCYEMEGALPYAPFVEILQATAEIVPRDVFREILGDSAAELARLFPELREMYPDIPPPVEIPPEQERRYTFNSIVRYMRRAAATNPLLLVLDDLHWADESTLRLLEQLALNLSEIPVVIIGTYRDVELAAGRPLTRTVEQLLRQRLMGGLSLKRLSEGDVRAMLHRLSGTEPPANAVSVIFNETEGNAFFVEEVFRHLTEEGKLFDPSGEWQSALRVSEIDVPETVRLVIGRRLERLGEETRRTLVTAAIIGRVFDLDLLGAASEIEEDLLLTAVDEAERARLISSSPHGRGVRYQFVHELVRQTLLADVLLPHRQRLHLKVAEAVERVHDTDLDKHVSDLAQHLYQAGATADAKKTVRYLLGAGDRARTAAAYEEALRSYESALSLVEDDRAQRAAILYKIGRANRGLGRWRDALSTWQEALSAFESLGDAQHVQRTCLLIANHYTWRGEWAHAVAVVQRGLDALGKEPSLARGALLAYQGANYSWLGDYGVARDCLDAASEVAAEVGDPRLIVGLLVTEAVHHWCFAHFTNSIEKGLEATAVLRAADAQWTLATTLSYLEPNYLFAGRWRDHDEIYEELWPLANRLNQEQAIRFASRWNGMLRYFRTGDMDRYAETWSRDLQFHTESEVRWVAEAHTELGWIELKRGDWDRALDYMIEGDRTAGAEGFKGLHWGALLLTRAYRGERSECSRMLSEPPVTWPRPGIESTLGAWFALMSAVEAAAVLGEWEQVAVHYDALGEYLRLGGALGSWLECVPVEALRAVSATAADRHAEAERHFEAALEWTRAHQTPMGDAYAKWLYSLALVGSDRKQDDERASSLLEDVVESWAELGFTRWVEMARELQARCATPFSESATEQAEPVSFTKEGEFWTLGTRESPIRLKDSVGLRHLQQLLKNPGTEIHCLDLVQVAEGHDRSIAPRLASHGGELLDDEAKGAYRKRVRALEEELEEAESWSDTERASRIRVEMQAITDELTRAVGLGGRDRKAISNAERARVNVTKAVRSAVKKIRGSDPDLGRHLEESLRTGTVCSYSPDPEDQISWKF